MCKCFYVISTNRTSFCYHTQATVFQAGKVNISDTSQNNHGCQSVSFKTQFQGSDDVKMIATLSHGSTYIKIHDPAALWVKSVSTSGFEACVRESGSGSSGASVISWLAFQGSYQGIYSGIMGFDEFTSRTQCKQISLGSKTNVSHNHNQLIGFCCCCCFIFIFLN